jgi:hypothetical protein
VDEGAAGGFAAIGASKKAEYDKVGVWWWTQVGPERDEFGVAAGIGRAVMASVIREIVINAKAEDCWDAVRDFGAVHQRVAPGFVTGLRMLSSTRRQVTFFNGAVATEELVGVDEQAKRLAYTVTDSALGSTHHNASAQVIADGVDRCRFVWTTDVLPDDLAEQIGALMDKAVEVIRDTLERDR